MRRALAVVLLIGSAGCGTEAASSEAARATPEGPSPAPSLPSASDLPHVGVITVAEVLQGPSSEMSQHVVAIRLIGDVGTSAIFRTLEIRARMVPIDGSACDGSVPPMVLRPTHPDAVQPALADETRTVLVRSLADAAHDGEAGASARFRVGPVPSLNGGFEGWVSFHFPADPGGGFCAFDVHGVVVIVAGETTSADLPVVRVDTRVPLDGG